MLSITQPDEILLLWSKCDRGGVAGVAPGLNHHRERDAGRERCAVGVGGGDHEIDLIETEVYGRAAGVIEDGWDACDRHRGSGGEAEARQEERDHVVGPNHSGGPGPGTVKREDGGNSGREKQGDRTLAGCGGPRGGGGGGAGLW